MAGSTIVAVKQALVTELSALGGMSAVSISYAHPGERGGKEILYCGVVRDGDHEAVALKAGRRRREENYELDVQIVVSGTKLTEERSETRAMVIGTLAEEYLADNPTINDVPNVRFVVVSGIEMETITTSNGPLTQLTLTVSVKARLL
jgi:hypothetical protein